MFSFTNCSEDPQTVRTVSVWCSGTRTACLGVWTTFFSRTLLPPRLRLLWQPSTLVVCLERWWAPRGPPCETEVVREELEGSKTTSDRGCVYVQCCSEKSTANVRSQKQGASPLSSVFPPRGRHRCSAPAVVGFLLRCYGNGTCPVRARARAYREGNCYTVLDINT